MLSQNSAEASPIDTRKELAAIAGTSKDLIAEKAKERMLAGKKIDPGQKSGQGKTDRELASIAGTSKDLIAEKAKENLKTHTKQGYQKSDKAIDTNKELAAIAGKAKGNETGHIYEGFTIQVIANVDYTGLQAVVFPGVESKFYFLGIFRLSRKLSISDLRNRTFLSSLIYEISSFFIKRFNVVSEILKYSHASFLVNSLSSFIKLILFSWDKKINNNLTYDKIRINLN